MAKASIVSIGNELLNGHTTDTNATYICRQLLSIGVPVVSVYAVGDDISKIAEALKRAAADGDIVIATGGLGPTDDDLTRQAFAELLSAKLCLDEKLLDGIRGFFEKRNLPMPERNKIQACIPDGAEAIENPSGTAPGILAKMKGRTLFALPGVPAEMKAMVENSVLPYLRKQGSSEWTVIKKVKCFGAGESAIAEKLGDLMRRGRNPLINCTVDTGVISLHVIATAKDKQQAEVMAQRESKRLRTILGELVYGEDEQTMAEVVGRELAGQRKTLATAESCTGGLVAKLITDIPGSSDYFTQGWVTYSNKAKVEQLGVSQKLIDKYGAVSEQVAAAMAMAAKRIAGSDFAIAITGIAGPGGGIERKPVGLVYIGVSSDNDCQTERLMLSGSREMIRMRAAVSALNMLRLKLKI
ncbi:MAG: competence/damage-inducible protein A [Sedimentisphaerales bacterium]